MFVEETLIISQAPGKETYFEKMMVCLKLPFQVRDELTAINVTQLYIRISQLLNQKPGLW